MNCRLAINVYQDPNRCIASDRLTYQTIALSNLPPSFLEDYLTIEWNDFTAIEYEGVIHMHQRELLYSKNKDDSVSIQSTLLPGVLRELSKQGLEYVLQQTISPNNFIWQSRECIKACLGEPLDESTRHRQAFKSTQELLERVAELAVRFRDTKRSLAIVTPDKELRRITTQTLSNRGLEVHNDLEFDRTVPTPDELAKRQHDPDYQVESEVLTACVPANQFPGNPDIWSYIFVEVDTVQRKGMHDYIACNTSEMFLLHTPTNRHGRKALKKVEQLFGPASLIR
tara:strand:+ start:605 stop:1456 length:852 start_codon:yes stop_codon:yes gene_type:complete